MENKFLYAMAQFDSDTEDKFRSLQEAVLSEATIDNNMPNFPAHITLGTFNVDDEAKIANKIIEISKIVERVPISFDSIGLFGMNVLFISPSTTYKLLNLRRHFEADCISSFNWVPHVTMIHDKPNNIQKSLPILSNKFLPFSGCIERISLYEFTPNRFIIEEKLI